MKKFAALDIGGTAVKYGIVDEAGAVFTHGEMPTRAGRGGEAVVKDCMELLRTLIAKERVDGVGVSTAGVVCPKSGEVLHANENLPEYAGTRWKERIQTEFGLAASVHNDVSAAALAEAWVGAAQGVSNFFCMTIGTGIGGAAFLNGRLYEGAHMRASEIGYMSTAGDADWYEKKASAAALVRLARRTLSTGETDGKQIFAAARKEVAGYDQLLETWYEAVAQGIANVIYLLDPGLILIGGGVSREGELLLAGLRRALGRILPERFMRETVLGTARCGNDAGMIGAVYELAGR